MDIRYYRKLKPPRFIQGAFRKFWKRPFLRWFFLLGVPLLLFATFNNKGILQRIRLEAEKKAWQQKVHQTQLEQQRLQQLSNALDTDTSPGGAIERTAREKYGMIREGETVYKIKKEK